MKKLSFFFISLLISLLYLDSDTIFIPIQKTYGFENFTSNDLYPFGYSKYFYKLDDKSSLKFIEELDIDNFLFNDILKVEVITGYYKGVICYIPEEFVKINLSDDSPVYVIFKYDTYSIDGKFISKNSKLLIKETKIENNIEILTLTNDKEECFDFSEKRAIKYITNKVDELNYALKDNKIVIKIVNGRNLFPIKDVLCGELQSDEDGIIIAEKKDIILKKSDYTKSYIKYEENQNIYLAFMEELKKIEIINSDKQIYNDDFIELYTDLIIKMLKLIFLF